MCLLRQAVGGVGVVDACGGDVVQPLPVTGLRLGDVDDVEDLGTAEAGDLHGSHAGQVRTLTPGANLGREEARSPDVDRSRGSHKGGGLTNYRTSPRAITRER